MADTTVEGQATVSVELGAVLDAGDGALVMLVAGETRLVAHKAVLVAGSPVFAAMFSHNTLEASSGIVTIPDIEGQVLRQLLAFLYTGRAPQLLDTAPLLLVASDKYGVFPLKDACEQRVIAHLDVENAAVTAVFAMSHSCPSLKQAAITFIKANSYPVMATRCWAEAVHSHPGAVVELTRLLAEPPAESSDLGPTPATATPPTMSHHSPPPDDAAVSRLRSLSGEEQAERLIQAGKAGAVEEVMALLAAGADVEAEDRDGSGCTTLQHAVDRGHVEMVQCLLQGGAVVDSRDRYMCTPLHWAAESGHTAVVHLLLAASADPNIRDVYGVTPLHWAAVNGHAEVAAALLQAGASKGFRSNKGDTPLDLARKQNHQQLIQMLE